MQTYLVAGQQTKIPAIARHSETISPRPTVPVRVVQHYYVAGAGHEAGAMYEAGAGARVA